jgi:endonuclease/exonuclease/phosphatase family metal-dependent hydrolase/cytochrome b561
MQLRNMVAVAVLTFFLQALRVLFSTLFGIIYDQVFEGPLTYWLGLSAGLVFAAMLTPLLVARLRRERIGPALALIAVVVRPLLTVNDASVRYFGALAIVAAGAGYLTLLLSRRDFAWRALIWALVLEQVLRALGDTFDLSLMDGFLPFQVGVSLVLAMLIVRFEFSSPQPEPLQGHPSWAAALALGVFLFLETSLLALPGAAARWDGQPYAPFALLILTATALPLSRRVRQLSTAPIKVLQAALLTGGLLLGYFAHGWLAGAGLIMAQGAACLALGGILRGASAKDARAGGRLAPALLVFLLLNFANAFAFTYPYTLPAMRGLGWVVYALACMMLGGALLMGRGEPSGEDLAAGAARLNAALFAGALLAVAWAVRPLPPAPLPQGGTVRLATWNIHYGYDDVWHTTLPDIAQAIKASGVDAIAMQEVDAGRMTSYGADNAYFLSRRLGMQAAYLPTVEHLTGIALLYKGEQAQVESALLPSLQEQTGIVRVHLPAAGGEIEAHAIWLGLSAEDTLAQIHAALDFIGAGTRASFGGDFNSEFDDPEIAAVLGAGFADPFQLLGISPPPLTDPAISPTKRIDFVFVRNLVPARAWVADSLASDHRMVVVEIAGE